MANKTPNYGLTKPLPEEFYDIAVHNENMDKIDTELKKKYDPNNKPTAADVGAFGVGGQIKNGDNLDDYTTMGAYYCNDTEAATIQNCPVSIGFMLEVFSTDDKRVLQILTPTSTSTVNRFIYYRKKVANSWMTNWYCLADTNYTFASDGSNALTGQLTIDPPNNTTSRIYLKGSVNAQGKATETRFIKNASDTVDYGTQIRDYSFVDPDGTKSCSLILCDAKETLPEKLQLLVTEGSSNKYYNIYHTGNKPTVDDIGAATTFHYHSAEWINGGTLGGAVHASIQTHDTSLLRNSKLVSAETTPTVNGEINWTYE